MIVRSRLVTFAALVAMLTVPLVKAHAQAQQKPVAMISISSIDSLLGNIQYLTEAAGQANYGQIAQVMADPYTIGLDRTKPIGLIVTTDGQSFLPLGFVGVEDLEQTLAQLEPQIGPARDAGNGILELAGPQPIFVKEQNGWAFIGQTVESLAQVPPNPAAMLKALPQDYDVAIRANVQNIPPMYRDLAVTTLQEGIKQGLQQVPEEDRAAQQEMMKANMKQLKTFINESDGITVGWKTDPAGKRTYLDMTFTAVPGGELAKQMAAMADVKSDYTNFLIPGAAMTMNVSSKIPPEQIQSSVQTIKSLKETALREIEKDDDLKSPEAKMAAKELLGAALDIFVATMATGKIDGGASVILKPQAMTVLGGFHVANGREVEKVLHRVAEMAKNEPDFPGINFNADSQAGVAFHTMTVPVPEEEDARKILGETLEMAVGVGDQAAYFGFGANCVMQLKSLIASQAKQQSVPPFQVTFSLGPVMEFIASIDDNPLVGSVTDALKLAGDKDHVKIHGLSIPNGFTYRIELEEGVLRALGEAIKMANAREF